MRGNMGRDHIMVRSSRAVMQSCSLAVLQSCSPAVLQSTITTITTTTYNLQPIAYKKVITKTHDIIIDLKKLEVWFITGKPGFIW